jgi:hypothetical protein
MIGRDWFYSNGLTKIPVLGQTRGIYHPWISQSSKTPHPQQQISQAVYEQPCEQVGDVPIIVIQ